MQGIILAAGRGRRLESHFSDPKGMLEISGEPIIVRNLRMLRDEGVTHVKLVVGYKANKLQRVCTGVKGLELEFIANRFYNFTNTLASLVLGLSNGSPCNDTDVVIINGDTVFESIGDLISHKNNVFGVKSIDPTEEEVKVTLNSCGHIGGIGKGKPGFLEAVGIYKVTPQFVEDVCSVAEEMSNFATAYYEDAFDIILQKHDVKPVDINAEEIDTWLDYLRAKDLFERPLA